MSSSSVLNTFLWTYFILQKLMVLTLTWEFKKTAYHTSTALTLSMLCYSAAISLSQKNVFPLHI